MDASKHRCLNAGDSHDYYHLHEQTHASSSTSNKLMYYQDECLQWEPVAVATSSSRSSDAHPPGLPNRAPSGHKHTEDGVAET
eukprot:1063574-Amphidinium_carterae.2